MGMMDVKEMKRIYNVKRFEFWIAVAALLGVMTFGILQGVVIGVLLSLFWLVAVSALPYIPELGRKPGTHAFFDLKEHPESQTYPGLSILRFDGGLFFVNADALGDRLRDVRVHAEQELNGVVLSMEGVNFIDAEGADMLKKIAAAGRDHGVDFHLTRVKPQVMEILQNDGVTELVGADHNHDDISAAVEMHMSKYPMDAPENQEKSEEGQD